MVDADRDKGIVRSAFLDIEERYMLTYTEAEMIESRCGIS